jgi:hypothetical protein
MMIMMIMDGDRFHAFLLARYGPDPRTTLLRARSTDTRRSCPIGRDENALAPSEDYFCSRRCYACFFWPFSNLDVMIVALAVDDLCSAPLRSGSTITRHLRTLRGCLRASLLILSWDGLLSIHAGERLPSSVKLFYRRRGRKRIARRSVIEASHRCSRVALMCNRRLVIADDVRVETLQRA